MAELADALASSCVKIEKIKVNAFFCESVF